MGTVKARSEDKKFHSLIFGVQKDWANKTSGETLILALQNNILTTMIKVQFLLFLCSISKFKFLVNLAKWAL